MGEREIIYLSLHCHHQNDSCIKMGSEESHFNVSLIVRDNVTRQCPQTTTCEEKGQPKRVLEKTRGLSAYQPTPYRWAKLTHPRRDVSVMVSMHVHSSSHRNEIRVDTHLPCSQTAGRTSIYNRAVKRNSSCFWMLCNVFEGVVIQFGVNQPAVILLIMTYWI